MQEEKKQKGPTNECDGKRKEGKKAKHKKPSEDKERESESVQSCPESRRAEEERERNKRSVWMCVWGGMLTHSRVSRDSEQSEAHHYPVSWREGGHLGGPG